MVFGNPLGQILSISMRKRKFIKKIHTVKEIGPVSLFQKYDLDRWKMVHVFAIPSVRSSQYQCVCKILSKIFLMIQYLWAISLFQNLDLGKASTDEKWHLAIPWARSCQNQFVCKIPSKYSIRFKRSVSFFPELGPQQSLNRWQTAFGNPFA